MNKHRTYIIFVICLSLVTGCFANQSTASALTKKNGWVSDWTEDGEHWFYRDEIFKVDDHGFEYIYATRPTFGLVAKNVTNVKIGRGAYDRYDDGIVSEEWDWHAYITQKNKNTVKQVDFFHKQTGKSSKYKLITVSKKGDNFYPLMDSFFTLDKQNRLLCTTNNSCYLFENHTRKQCASAISGKYNEVVEEGLNPKKIWYGDDMLAYVKNNNLYITGRAVRFSIPDSTASTAKKKNPIQNPYADKECYEYNKPMVFFEGQGNKIKNVVCGDFNSGNIYVLMKDGSVWGMGSNEYKQIADSKQKYYYNFEKILSGGVKKLSVGTDFVAVIKENNNLYLWGDDIETVNIKKSKASHKPKKIADNVKEVSVSGTTLVYLKKNGTAYAMGLYSIFTTKGYKFKSGWKTKPYKLMEGVKHIYTGDYSVLLLKKNKELYWAGTTEHPSEFKWVEKKLSK